MASEDRARRRAKSSPNGLEDVRVGIMRADSRARRLATQHPALAIAGAVLAGYLAGRILRARG